MRKIWIALALFIAGISSADAKNAHQQTNGKKEASHDYRFDRRSEAANRLRSYGRSPTSMDPQKVVEELSFLILTNLKGRERVVKGRDVAISKEIVEKVTAIVSDLGRGEDYSGNIYPTDEQLLWTITFDKLDELGQAVEKRHGPNQAHADAFQNLLRAIEVEDDAIFHVSRK